MKRTIKIGISILIAAGLIYMAAKLQSLHQHMSQKEQLSSSIANEVMRAKEESLTVSLKDHTVFQWDTMWAFSPYTTPQKINERLGYRWTDTYLSNDDSQHILVFLDKGKVVEHLIYDGFINSELLDRPLTIEEAVIKP